MAAPILPAPPSDDQGEPLKSGIYAITCTVTGKVYVGSSAKISARFNQHKNMLRHGRHYNRKLQNAWNKYGEPAFVFSVLSYVKDDELLTEEQKWIDKLGTCGQAGFNLRPDASSMRGYKHTDETRAKHSARLKGKRPLIPDTPEIRAKINAAKTGYKFSDEARRKMSDSAKARHQNKPMGPRSEEHRAKLAEAKRLWWASKSPEDRKHTEETKRKIGASQKGKKQPLSEAHRAAVVAANKKRWDRVRELRDTESRRDTYIVQLNFLEDWECHG